MRLKAGQGAHVGCGHANHSAFPPKTIGSLGGSFEEETERTLSVF